MATYRMLRGGTPVTPHRSFYRLFLYSRTSSLSLPQSLLTDLRESVLSTKLARLSLLKALLLLAALRKAAEGATILETTVLELAVAETGTLLSAKTTFSAFIPSLVLSETAVLEPTLILTLRNYWAGSEGRLES